VYRQQVDRLCDDGLELARSRPGADGLREWMESFVDFMGAKRGFGETLRAVLTSEDDRQQTRHRLRATIGALLDAGVAEGSVRPEIDPYDLLLSLGGITLIAAEEEQRALASRLITLLLIGVAARVSR